MTKDEFQAVVAKPEADRTEEEVKSMHEYGKEFQDKYTALAEEYGLDFSATATITLVPKK